MFHLSEQKSTKHFCVVAELADDLDPFALLAPYSRSRVAIRC